MITSEWILGNEDIALPLEIRKAVFLYEMGLKSGCDTDPFDQFATNAVMYEDNKPAATARLYYGNKGFVIDYLCVLKQYRKQRIGDLLARLMIYKACQFADKVYTKTITDSKGFFARYGFKEFGDIYSFGGVPIIDMQINKEDVALKSACGCN